MSDRVFAVDWHFGRSFHDTRLEDKCPCDKAPCGLVYEAGLSDDCDQHPHQYARTIRQSHTADECPGSADAGSPDGKR